MKKELLICECAVVVGILGGKLLRNCDVKTLALSHDTVKNAVYLGVGIIVLKIILDFANKRYEIKREYELEKLLLETNKEEE